MICTTSLRWQLMLTLALCPVLVLSAEYCVKPTTAPATTQQIDNVMGTPCLVFNDYLANQDRYFKSNTAFKFLPGIHEMNKSLHIENLDNFQLVRASNKSSREEITIAGSNDTDIAFRNHSNIRIEGMRFSLSAKSSGVSLTFFNGTNLTLQYLLLDQYMYWPHRLNSRLMPIFHSCLHYHIYGIVFLLWFC